MATLFAEGGEEFGGGDDLAGVALCVVGDVDEEASDGGGELAAANGAREFEAGGGEAADSGAGVFEARMKFVEDGFDGAVRRRFAFESRELGCGELIALGVSKEAIEAARDMAEVEGERGKAEGLRVKVIGGEAHAPAVDIFGGEFECVQDGEMDGREIFEVAAEPGFGVGTILHGQFSEGIVLEILPDDVDPGRVSVGTAKSGCATFVIHKSIGGRNHLENKYLFQTMAVYPGRCAAICGNLRSAERAADSSGGCAEIFGGCEDVDDAGDGRAGRRDARSDARGASDCCAVQIAEIAARRIERVLAGVSGGDREATEAGKSDL